MPKKLLIPYLDGQWLAIRRLGDNCGLNEINKRIEYWIPIDTVDVKAVMDLIDFIHINVNRDCTPEEVRNIVESMKSFLKESIEKMPHNERHMYDTYESTAPPKDMPKAEVIELIEADKMRKVIKAMNLRCDRSLTPEEAAQMIESTKKFMLDAVDRMEKYESNQTEYEGTGPGDSEEIL